MKEMRKFFDETIAEHLPKARILYWTELSFALARNTAAISDTGVDAPRRRFSDKFLTASRSI
jgi:hypothetical protein